MTPKPLRKSIARQKEINMITVNQIFSELKDLDNTSELVVAQNLSVSTPCSLARPKPNGVCFFNKKRWVEANFELDDVSLLLSTTRLDADQKEDLIARCSASQTALILMENPRVGFISLIKAHFTTPAHPGIHPSAVVDASAQVHPSATIRAGAVIGPNVTIGADTEISEQCVIQARAQIGANCYLAPGVKMGQRGFGYERNSAGEMQHFPHIGSIILGDNVEVGANTCIDRGTIDDTIIHNGVKIDNLCHISHNVEIMENAVVIANSMIGGSVRIGQSAWIAPSANIINSIEIGDGVTAGMGSTVVKPVPAGQTVAGSPAVEMSQFLSDRRTLKDIMKQHEKSNTE